EVWLRQAGAVGDVAHRGRPVGLAVQRQRQQGAACVVAAGRDLHGTMLRAAGGLDLRSSRLEPVLPDYDGACLSNVVPALFGADARKPDWLPPGAADAGQV